MSRILIFIFLLHSLTPQIFAQQDQLIPTGNSFTLLKSPHATSAVLSVIPKSKMHLLAPHLDYFDGIQIDHNYIKVLYHTDTKILDGWLSLDEVQDFFLIPDINTINKTLSAPSSCSEVQFSSTSADFPQLEKYRQIQRYQPQTVIRWGDHEEIGPLCLTYNAEICEVLSSLQASRDLTQSHLNPEFFALIKAIIYKESRFEPNAMRFENSDLRKRWRNPDLWDEFLKNNPNQAHSSGSVPLSHIEFESSYGLMQVMAFTALDLSKKNPELVPIRRLFEPKINLKYGILYLKQKFDQAHAKDVLTSVKTQTSRADLTVFHLAAAAYNAGGIRVDPRSQRLSCHGNYSDDIVHIQNEFLSTCQYAALKWEGICKK